MVFNIRNTIKYIYILCIVIYNLQAIVFENGSIICMIAVAIVMAIGLICFFMCFKMIKRPIFNSLFVLLFITTISFLLSDKYVISSLFVISISTISQLQSLLYNILFVFTFYYFTIHGIIKEKDIKIIFYVFLMEIIFSFFKFRNIMYQEYSVDEFTNNYGSVFACLLPYIYFEKKKNIQIILLVVLSAFILMCAKRGAMFMGMVFIVYYFYKEYKQSGKNNIKIIIPLIIILGIIAIYRYFKSSDYLQYRMEATMEGRMSNRENMYPAMIKYYLNSNNIWHYIFGFGLLTSVKITGFLAHQDWLEILLNNGLLGVVVYAIFFIQVKNETKKTYSNINRTILISIIIVWLAKTMFSMAINDVKLYPLPILLGYMIGKNDSGVN